MPELPEVETIRRDLQECILGVDIAKVVVRLPRLVRGNKNNFIKNLQHSNIVKIDRIGKLLMFFLDNEKVLLVHLKMTGQLIYQKNKNTIAGGHSYGSDTNIYPNKYTYIIITFIDDSELYFNDMRTFGYMELIDKNNLEKVTSRYGIEPLRDNFTLDNFKKVLHNRKTTIKAVLLNQQLIAGIGNIYADEICFAAGVLPDRSVTTLTKDEINLLFQESKKILKKAIKYRGTTFSDYVDSKGRSGAFSKHLQVFGRQGLSCYKCKKGKIQKTKVAGRGTHFCNICQK